MTDLLQRVNQLVTASSENGLHPIGIREIASGSGALHDLPQVVRRLGIEPGARLVVLTDDVSKLARGVDVADQAATLLHGYDVTRVTVAAHQGDLVHADEETVNFAVDAVAAAAPAAVVTVGSGTMADIGKVAAHRLGLVHVIVQTAASVNGFADDQSVLLINGTKRTTPSRWPEAIVIDTDVLAAAPAQLTRSGLGDQISMFTAAADWRLASVVGFDPTFSPTAVAVLQDGALPAVLSGERLAANEPQAVHDLAIALTRGGLAMGVAGRTSPSSGTEHTISHLLDMRANAEHRPAGAHGTQVGVGSVVATAVWAMLRERLSAAPAKVAELDPDVMRTRVFAAFGVLDESGVVAEECWSAYCKKLIWINENLTHLQTVCDEWATTDAEVDGLLTTPEVVGRALRDAGAASRFADLEPQPTHDVARWALANCHLMRDRFTVVDLAEVTGNWTDDDVEQVWAATQVTR
jgi:glycerol-1-phosphate dehydrogenase [NAD(P)+]